jgi:PAS domain S-box-containing protein
MLLILDQNGIIASWNAGAQRFLGHTTQQAIGHHVSMLFRTDDRVTGSPVQQLLGAEPNGPVSAEHWLAHADGSARFADITVSAFGANSDSGFALLARAATPPSREIDGPKGDVLATRLEDTLRQLAESNALLSSEIADRTQGEAARIRLLRRLVMAQEDERRRIARDLHDDLGQRLTTLRLTLEALATGDGNLANVSKVTESALTTLAQIDQGIDFLAWELRPAALDELGLTRVLDNYVNEWAQHAGVRAAFHSSSPEMPRFPPEVEATVYRITQEALNNVAKHAGARSVNILLEQRDDELVLAVEDDGAGCDPTGSSETMVGLIGMRERAEAVGGSVEIEPTPGGGTTVLAHLPMSTPSPVIRFHDRAVDPGVAATAAGGTVSPNDVPDRGLNVLRARLQELQQAVSARDEFIATVAHELRNPVAPLMFQIRLAIEKSEKLVAAGEPLSIDWVQSQLRRIEQRLHRLLETLERLLDVSRLATGRIDLQPEPVDLGRAVREVIATFDAEMAIARCQLVWSQRGEATGWWDRMRLEQICRNLMSNAIRFGAGRPIEVVVDGDRDFAMLQVRDHGVGIAPHHHARIFERFERGLERSGGFGIGLWVVKSVCVAMGGSISVESQVGEGACFTVMLPRRSEPESNDQRAEDR